MVRTMASGDVICARKLHHELLPLFDVLFCETNPIPIKAACAALGWCDGEIRLPMLPITTPNLERLKVVLKDLGILQ
jgi:4-hydroxy-tetrahydrodipicolinate synthase